MTLPRPASKCIRDFVDVQFGPDGVPWAARVDVCAAKGCKAGPGPRDFGEGFVATMVGLP